jgi:23S rRNA (adenine-N6)-dimethyltransferase
VAAAPPRHRPPPRWGWHPLRPEWADRLVASSPVRAGDVVVDLGAGDGAVTVPLALTGCRVLAVELHPRRATGLRERFAGTRVAVIELDVAAFRSPGHPFRVVANPPYAGVNALVRRLLAVRTLSSADLVVAEGAARGLVARYGDRLTLGAPVPRLSFRHPPPGRAVVLRIRS